MEGHFKLPSNALHEANCNNLQRNATRCNTLQHEHFKLLSNALHNSNCNTLQHTKTRCNTSTSNCSTTRFMKHTATHGHALQHAATHCHALQHAATHLKLLSNAFHKDIEPWPFAHKHSVYCSVHFHWHLCVHVCVCV